MAQIPSYNLLQDIDPTKIKVPISDRFAKLTLSSNKKQQQKFDEPDQQEELKRQQVKRDSVSRNIAKDFNDKDKQEDEKLEQNPLLRSESSKETECNAEGDEEVVDFSMEPLEVSLDYNSHTQVENDLELLSQQMASMVVEPKVISLSSGTTGSLSELFSTESQCPSDSGVDNIHIVRNIPINVKDALNKEAISLNLTYSTHDDIEKTYEMTDDEDEEDEKEEDDVITISDSTKSHNEEIQDVMTYSSSTSLTSETLSLPCLMDNRAERVAAYLRDVSEERRAMLEEGHLVFYDTVDQILDNKEIDEIQENIEKLRQIATADTESMTPDVDDEVTPKSRLEREKRLKTLDEIGKKEKSNDTNCKTYQETEEEVNAYISQVIDSCIDRNVHRLANDETQDNTVMTDNNIENTSTILSNFNGSLNQFSPKTKKIAERQLYRIANDDTQCNSDYSMAEETPKIPTSITNQYQQNSENRRMPANLGADDNTLGDNDLTRNKSKIDPRRLVNEDTLANSIMSYIDEALTQRAIVHKTKTPDKSSKTIKTERNSSPISIQTTSPQSSVDSGRKNDSFNSVINTSTEHNSTAPEHSIIILETDDESVKQSSPLKSENVEDKKLSNSFHREDSSDESEYSEQIQMPVANINISAKINIKIHISNTASTETSEDDQNYERASRENKRGSRHSNQLVQVQTISNEEKISLDEDHIVETNDQSMESEPTEELCCNQIKAPTKDIAFSANESPDSVEVIEDKKFLTEAEKLLTQLYGNTWQTPEVIRTLKHTSHSSDKKSNESKYCLRKKNDIKNSPEKRANSKSTVEESILDDFSIFRRNIVKTNLDSTRLATPKTAIHNKNGFTEPKNNKKVLRLKENTDAKLMPQSERKPCGPSVAKVGINKRRVENDRWRQLIDGESNSEGDNASDDDDADESWSRNASELEDHSDSDFDNSPQPRGRNRKNNKTINQGRSDKSDYLNKILNNSKKDELVYLDLSKEEVEVQDEVPESPPANHDVTFIPRLQDILRTCSSQPKDKLLSSNKKTKRKLFTPHFGSDDFELAFSKEDDGTKVKENISKTNNRNNVDDDGILKDTGNCPFDSQGRPKVFDLVNKQLESVKAGTPIFQLTPTSKKKNISKLNTKSDSGNTPKTKSEADARFKTPTIVKSKGPAKTLSELTKTPNYKYSFLKSLDVTVSKALCHPDAWYYRENYRTKKEDLSKILYDLYNEKLFKNELEVPLSWNKKLLNTAGRCMNKKKLGTRSCVVQLSDKVLTSADRLRCTLIHELCHAATWIFNGEGGHGSTWKEWARKANATFPEIPKIGVCHQYDIEYKYTYKCTLCGAKSHAHSKSKKVDNIRCSYCHGAIEIFLNKKDKDGNVMPTPVKEPTGFAKFVQENYKKFKRDDLKHADIMKLLSSEFASLKVTTN